MKIFAIMLDWTEDNAMRAAKQVPWLGHNKTSLSLTSHEKRFVERADIIKGEMGQ
jgi:hypothetical protein